MTQLPPEKSLPEALADALAATRAAIPPDAVPDAPPDTPPSTDVHSLQKSLITISEISEGRLSEICALSFLLLEWMKVPGSSRKMAVIADVLNVIWERAETVLESINNLAEAVGCWQPGTDQDRRERMVAFSKALTVGP